MFIEGLRCRVTIQSMVALRSGGVGMKKISVFFMEPVYRNNQMVIVV